MVRRGGVVCASNQCEIGIANRQSRSNHKTNSPPLRARDGAPCGGMFSVREFQLPAPCGFCARASEQFQILWATSQVTTKTGRIEPCAEVVEAAVFGERVSFFAGELVGRTRVLAKAVVHVDSVCRRCS